MQNNRAPTGQSRVVFRLLPAALVGSVLLGIYFAGNHYFRLDRLAEREASLRGFLEDYPVYSFLACFFLYVLVSFVPGTTGKSLVVGWLFGFWQALVIVNVALTVAATSSLAIGRYFLRDAVTRRWGRFVNVANRELTRDGGFYVLLLRILHAPYTVVNYSLGATFIRVRTFWWATQIGILPGNVLFVYAGVQLPSLRHISRHGIGSLLTPELIAAFALLTIVPFAIRWIVRRLWPGLGKGTENATEESGPSPKTWSAEND